MGDAEPKKPHFDEKYLKQRLIGEGLGNGIKKFIVSGPPGMNQSLDQALDSGFAKELGLSGKQIEIM